MDAKKLILVIAFLLLGVTLIGFPNAKLAGLTTVNTETSTLLIALETTKIAVNAPVKGTLNISLTEDLDPSEQLQVLFNGRNYTTTIEALLTKANYTIEYESTQFNATNEATEKSLTFSSAGSQFTGFKIPRYAEVSALTFTLVASPVNTVLPQAVGMDLGNEGTLDWYYLGSFLSSNTTKVQSPDLDSTSESLGYVEANTYYCEFLPIPRTKHLLITADYTKLSASGDIKATVLSVPTGDPEVGWEGGSDTCDLPESGSEFCTLELEYTIEGEYLVCLSSSGAEGTNLYSIPLDSSQETDTAYTCSTTQNSVCQETGFNNFFITLQGGVYNNTLSGEIPLEDWETFTDALLTAVQYYVGSTPYNGLCKTSSCSVPLNVTSKSAGILTVSDLSLIYDFNGITQGSAALYDMSLPQADMTSIESQVLEDGAMIEIPLELLEITEATVGDYSLDISFLGDTTSAPISVREASEIFDATTLIQTATTRFNEFLDQNTEEYIVLTMLDIVQGLEQTLKDLGGYKNQVGFIEEEILLTQIETTLQELPWEITSSQTTKEILKPKSSDIPASLENTEEILTMQEAITVVGTIKTVTIETYRKEATSYILIVKEITANEDIEDAVLYEQSPIPFSTLLYTVRPEKSSGTEAQYTLSLKSGDTKTVYYLTTEAVSLDDFQSVLVREETAEETDEPQYICGDGICDATYEDNDSCREDCSGQLNLWYILIPVVLALLGILGFLIRKKMVKKYPPKIK